MLRTSYALYMKCVILHMQAVPAMSVVCFWEDSMVSASSIQISHKRKGMEREKGNNTGIISPSKKARSASCLELSIKQMCVSF